MRTSLIIAALVLSPVILPFAAAFVLVATTFAMEMGREEQYHRVYHDERLIRSPDGSHTAIIKEGHYEPYFVSPPFFTEVWISRNQSIAAPAVKVHDGSSQAMWTDDGHLTVTLDGLHQDGTSIHEADGVKVKYHLSGHLRDEYFALNAKDGVKEKGAAPSIALPSYYEFRKWARENTDNAE